MRGEKRRDHVGLVPKSKREKENRLRLTGDTQGHDPLTQRTRIDTDTEGCKGINICINKMTNSNNPQWGAGRLKPNRLANRCRCLFVNAHKRGRSEVLPEAHGHSSEQREPP